MSEFVFELDDSKLFSDFVQKEEIIRCRDCVHGFVNENQVFICDCLFDDYHSGSCYSSPDGFCSWAFRRFDG